MIRIAMLLLLALAATSCAHLNYFGETHPPTTQVAVFFSPEDVERPYRVIGQMIATGDQFISSSKLQEKLMAKAREQGADAVIVESFGAVPLTEATRYTETTRVTKQDSTHKETKKVATVENAAAEGMEIRALFIRYRE